ncbi:MAG: hypothetical protein JXL84_08380 [Deltaproteobacteria bacterium]|nr:hypothetical protein [Deltaproteobacteria bacterium]
MDEEEYRLKYAHLRILKSIQEYLKSEGESHTALFPVKVPDDFLCQVMRLHGTENADRLIHQVFRLGLTVWSEKLFEDVFGSQQSLEDFIDQVKKRVREDS